MPHARDPEHQVALDELLRSRPAVDNRREIQELLQDLEELKTSARD